MIKKIKLSIVILLYFAVVVSLNAQQSKTYTPYFITFGASANANWHTSEFNYLPGTDTTLTTFSNAFGLGWSAYLGLEYEMENPVFGGKLRPYAQLSYSNISATFEDDEEIGHVIKPDGTYPMGISKHELSSNYTVLGVEAGVVYYLPMLDDFAIKLGMIGGMLGDKTFEKKEKLTSPEGAFYDEFGNTERNAAGGDIQEAASAYFGVNLGARYDLLRFDDFILAPEFNFTLGLSGLNNEIDWTANALKFGVNLQYNIPETVPDPPLRAPMPAMPKAPMPPPPPAKKDLTIALDIYYQGEKLSEGQEIPVKVNQIINRSSFSVLPVFFFEQNESDNNNLSSPKRYFLNEYTAQQNIIARLADFLVQNPSVRVELNARQLQEESEGMAEKRAKNISAKLQDYLVDESRISENFATFEGESFRYPELASENRSVWVKLSDGNKLIHFYTDTTTIDAVEEIELKIDPRVVADTTIKSFDCEVMLNRKKDADTNVYPFYYRIQDNTLMKERISSLDFVVNIEDELGQTAQDKMTIYLTPDIRVERTNENLIDPQNSDQKIRKYILGFFRFDGSEFYAVNEEALSEAKRAIADGKSVEITPLTDNLGEQQYNINLAKRRAKAALRLIGSKESIVKINETTSEMFSNRTPEGRILNRSIILIINE